MFNLLTQEQLTKLKPHIDSMSEAQNAQYIYSKGFHDVGFFIDFFLGHYKQDKKTGEKIPEAPFHHELRTALKSKDDTLVIVPRDHAKCLKSDSLIKLSNGLEKEIKDIDVGDRVLSIDDNLKVVEDVVTNKFFSGIKEVFEVKVRGERKIEGTKDHRVLTLDGWKTIGELTKNDYIASSRKEPVVRTKAINNLHMKFISYMIFEGATSSGNCAFTQMKNEALKDFKSVCYDLGFKTNESGKYAYKVSSGARKLLRKYGLYGLTSKEKRLPESFFKMPKRQKWEFINILFETDGYFCKDHFGITLANEGLIKDINNIFKSVGLNGSVIYKPAKYKGKLFDAWNIRINNYFVQKVLKHCILKDKRKNVLRYKDIKRRSFMDIYPNKIKQRFTINNFNLRKKGIRIDNKYEYAFDKISRVCSYDNSIELHKLHNADISRAKVLDIKSIGYHETYDISVNNNKNFITDGLVVHNSTTNFFILMHDICYNIEPSILLIMAKGLGLETIGKIRDEFETNEAIKKVFGKLVPNRSREEANKKRTQNQLQFLNDVTIESVTMGGSIRGKRPTKIVVDDPQENSDVANKSITDKFNYWFWSSVYNTLDPSGKCVVIGTVVGSLCLVNHILQEGRGFHAIKYEAIEEPEYELIKDKRHIVGGNPIRPEKRSIEQLNERMQTIGEEVFMQEYMNRPTVALGSPVYKHSEIDKIILKDYEEDLMRPGLNIFGPPSDTCVFACDTSLGDIKGDYSGIVVRDSDYTLLATYKGHIAPDRLCLVINHLRELGYKGDIAIESNNTGIATLHEARDYERSRYLYKTQVFDKVTNQTTQKMGWNTNNKTRPAMVENHKKLFYNGTIKEFDKRQLDEMCFFYYNEKGKPEAVAPHHDDLVISDMICCKIIIDLYGEG